MLGALALFHQVGKASVLVEIDTFESLHYRL
jgi:hypothetical protein